MLLRDDLGFAANRELYSANALVANVAGNSSPGAKLEALRAGRRVAHSELSQ
jgi:hypothetical protein